MIQIAAQIRILVAVEAIDGRKGIDAIAQLCREKLNADPFSGYLFIFRTRHGTAIRVLQYDGQGFWLATKRLSKGRFKWWPTGTDAASASGSATTRCRQSRSGSPAAVAAVELLGNCEKTLAFHFRLCHTDGRWLRSGDIEGG
jgi:transposase